MMAVIIELIIMYLAYYHLKKIVIKIQVEPIRHQDVLVSICLILVLILFCSGHIFGTYNNLNVLKI